MKNEERKAQVKEYLGKTVTVKIDRPFGSAHPKYTDLIYPVNYGYIPFVIGGDGEELDVYVLGVSNPVETFTGRVIGIVHRENDNEDKLVAAPENMMFYQNEIAEKVNFQEQYFKYSVEGLYQKSCGVIIYRRVNKAIEFLLLFQRKSKTWSFPKGHMEIGETETETALREAYEETGLKVNLISDFREEIDYLIDNSIKKKTVLFMSEVTEEPVIQKNEILKYRWARTDKARALMNRGYGKIIEKISTGVRP